MLYHELGEVLRQCAMRIGTEICTSNYLLLRFRILPACGCVHGSHLYYLGARDTPDGRSFIEYISPYMTCRTYRTAEGPVRVVSQGAARLVDDEVLRLIDQVLEGERR